jgi:hypothetical protein
MDNLTSERRQAPELRLSFGYKSNKRTFHRRTGTLLKSTVNANYKVGRLDRLTLNMPRYSFQQHFGSSLTGTQSYRKKRSICQVISKTFRNCN